MYVTWELILSICGGFAAICLSVGYLIKIYHGLRKPSDEKNKKIKDNKSAIDSNKSEINDMKETLDYLVSANNLVIRSLFTVLGELSQNNDVNGHCATAQNEIQRFLTPVKDVKEHV